MKNLALILAIVFGLSLQSTAHGYGYSYINSYADAIVFDEMGVTFSVYPDGEFDFYLDNALQRSTVSNGFVNVTFNSGYNYNPYVQYDDFGAVIQVENVPIWYDHFGRVIQIGDVQVTYRNRRVCRVGGLNIFYNGRGHYAYHTGFINVWNPYFVYRPFYVAFARPRPAMCFVRTTPYRQYYRPVRYTYYRPYVNNVRPHYATVGHTYRPSGYGRVHARYTQNARRGETPVRRERRKITTANVTQRQSVTDRARMNVRGGNASYSRGAQQAKPVNMRSSSLRTNTNSRSTKPNSTAVRTSTSRTVQTAPNRGASSSRVSQRSESKPRSVSSRTNGSVRGQAVKPTSRGTSNSRAVKPTVSGRAQSVNRSSSRVSSGQNRSVQPRTSSRTSASPARAAVKPSGYKNRVGSRANLTKGSTNSSRTGGKVSVGNRSSKRGR